MLSNTNLANLDIYNLLNHLHRQKNPGSCDLLINQLHEQKSAEIDFFLPQLVFLYIRWNEPQASRLGNFLANRCAQSPHLALKLSWILSAMEYYQPFKLKKKQLQSLRDYCETQLINFFEEKTFFPNTAPLTSQEFNAAINKEYKSNYFNQEINLIHQLQNIADVLISLTPVHRKLALKKLLKTLNEKATGLYFPTNNSQHAHYRILKIDAEECIALSSRDKAPFLFFMEIQKTNKNIYDPNLHIVDPVNLETKEEKATVSNQSFFKSLPTSANWLKLDAAFGTSLAARKQKMGEKSKFRTQLGNHWDVISVIYKSGDDCRQEVLAMQLISLFQSIWAKANLPLYLHPYSVLITGPMSGLIETINDATSIDALKKGTPNFTSLKDFFRDYYPSMQAYDKALTNFVESMAGYSVVSYLLQLKDRHNGNIMLTRAGHIVHIDFGFMLMNSPGKNINFESSPFKLTKEFVDVMGGVNSPRFITFRLAVIKGFLEARKHADKFMLMIDIASKGDPGMSCFAGNAKQSIDLFRERFLLNHTEEMVIKSVNEMIDQSIDNWRSNQYDQFQKVMNGIR